MSTVGAALEAIRRRAAPGSVPATGVDVHFHPDATAADGRTVLGAILSTGRWRTQFETGTSNGGRTAHPGGDRWAWEARLFDSAYGPQAVGTPDRAGAVLATMATTVLDDPLDRYVEAHVHGGVTLADVEAVVLDPSFRGTPVEPAAPCPVAIEWHRGSALDPGAIPSLAAYRGRQVSDAASRIAGTDPLTPYRLGLVRDELDPVVAKRIWHLLAAFGAGDPAASIRDAGAGRGRVSGGSAAPA